jgi:UDP-2,4-diacetamido-2,4,6-trideoxy-beta-L-altropyranose hydrolase
MRCLALAQAWQDNGGRVIFAMAEVTSAVTSRLAAEGMEVIAIDAPMASEDDARFVGELAREQSAACVVLDGYHFDAAYETKIKSAGVKLLLVDDAGFARACAADLILNANSDASESMYPQRKEGAKVLLGTRYALLRREFLARNEWKRQNVPVARHVLVTMGGSDPDNLTSLAVQALGMAKTQGLRATIVAGGSNPRLDLLRKEVSAQGANIQLQDSVLDMPDLMAQADMAIIAGGGTLWELLYMSCPVLSFGRASVQRRILDDLDAQGIVKHLGDPQDADPASLANTIDEWANSQEKRARMAKSGREKVDGDGATRVRNLLAVPDQVPMTVTLQAIVETDRDAFLRMAEQHFRGLNPAFSPQEDWTQHYFSRLLASPRMLARWIMVGSRRAGFALYGVEDHRFLPRLTGMIYEVFVLPEFRRMGVARTSARLAIDELQRLSPTKIQLEVMEGNDGAVALWRSLGFEKVAARFVMKKTKG